ncbi:unnamed protein product [Owenia fusiformis]|uniref:Aspartoacylase n=1 Tax=Owenia fusiformis TaxID=6347 RepID=A0A8S4Q5K7_OWEFU|nr:unnamed protein product [Owenia fusiformis]
MEVYKKEKIENVCIFGGTHGNELSGVYLVRNWLKDGALVQRGSFSTHLVIANPRAVDTCRRYIDRDLNRCYGKGTLGESTNAESPYETKRAQELYHRYLSGAPPDGTTADFLIDLHNTSSAAGNCIIIPYNASPVVLQVCVELIQRLESLFVRVLVLTEQGTVESTAGSCKNTIGVEIGPQHHGTLKTKVYDDMSLIVTTTLDILDQINKGELFPERQLEVYSIHRRYDYPRDEDGQLNGTLHPDFEEKDWQPLKNGDNILRTLDGADIRLENETETVYPCFVGEAAYYEKGLAFWTTLKTILKVEKLPLDD